MRRRTVALLAGGTLLIVGAAATGLYLDRVDLARRAMRAWLSGSGAEADVQFETVGPNRLAARLRIGPADRPGLTVDHAEVDYSLGSFLRGHGPQITAVRLRHPVLNARWTQGRLDLGDLDRLKAQLQGQPGPAAPPPRIEVQDGLVRLATEIGLVQARGDAVIDHGRPTLISGAVTLPPLDRDGLQVEIGPVAVRARQSAERLLVAAEAPLVRGRYRSASVQGGRLSVQADLAYAALPHGVASGRLTADLTLDRAAFGDLQATGLVLALQSPDLTADLRSQAVAGDIHLRATAAEARRGALALTGVSAEGAGALRLARRGLDLRLRGHADGSGAWSALGPPRPEDAPVSAAVKRTLAGFRASAADAELTLADGRIGGRLLGPVWLESASGGKVRLAPAGGGYRLEVRGGGLPVITAEARDVALRQGAFTASASLNARFTLGLLRDATVQGSGTLVLAGSSRFSSKGCAAIAAPRLELGENDAEDFSARLCPAGAPLLTVSPGRWTIAGTLREARARLPSFEVGVEDGSGPMRLSGREADLSAEVTVTEGRVSDLAKPLRFNPLQVSGAAGLADHRVTAELDFRTPKGFAVAHVAVTHNLDAMAGRALVSAEGLTFAQGGLQPSDLSPLTAAIGEPATAAVDFSGRYDWAAGHTTSSGRLAIRHLDFKSALGLVENASGELALTSLSPLAGATVGEVHADRVTGLLPITALAAAAVLKDEVLTVSAARGSLGGGLIEGEAVLPLDKTLPAGGEVRLSRVQVHDLVEASPFGDRVDFTARITGRLPFQLGGGQLRIAGGAMKADGPGRLSISRTALKGGSKPGAAESPIADFAYQAMENLAFDVLDASVDSRSDGRLGMLFHIKGRHDPPTLQEITLPWLDVIRRKFLTKPLPLPSGTAVNLTLDTTLNLDNLLRDYGDLRRRGGSPSVQPAPGKFGADPVESPR